ncbi:MAG: aminopeptidase, partial [Acidobacteria bacterium]
MPVLAFVMALFLPMRSSAQETASKRVADPRIAAALKDVSAARIQASIEKLVSFGTRLTLSAQDPAAISAGRGIGAAREW